MDEQFRINNISRDPLYLGNKSVICEFCKTSSDFKEEGKFLGRLYGPYKLKTKFISKLKSYY
jgi:hypothetical protein